MCDPVTGTMLLSTALTGAGTAAQYRAQSRRQEESEDAALAEAMRQDRIDQAKMENFDKALQGVDRASQEENIQSATAEREQLFDLASELPGQDSSYQAPSSSGAPRVVQEYADEQGREAQDFLTQLGDSRARLGAWGEGMTAFSEDFQDNSFWLDELNKQARRSGQIGQREAENAYRNTANDTAFAGNLASQLGQMGLQYAGSQGAFSGGGPRTRANLRSPVSGAPTRTNPYNPAAVRGAV